MNRLLKAAGALLCAIGLSLPASAQLTTITANSIKMAGTAVSAGTVTFTPTNSIGTPISLTAGGTLYDPQGFTAPIASGAITGSFSVPDACTSSATVPGTEIFYQVTVLNTVTKKSFTLTKVAGVCGASWALDSYVPTQSAPVTATGLLSSVTVPAHCTGTSVFYTQTTPPVAYGCVGGVYVYLTGSGGGATLPTTTGIFKGNGLGGASVAQAGVDYATPANVSAAQSAAIASAVSTGVQKSSLTDYVKAVNGKTGAATLTAFDVGAVAGPVGGSSQFYTGTEQGGATIDTVQGAIVYWIPAGTSSLQVNFGNVSTASETCGPKFTVRAAVEYPADATPKPLFFGGKRDMVVDPCGNVTTDPLEIDTSATLQAMRVRYRVVRDPSDSTVFPANWIFTSVAGNNSVLAPYTTTVSGQRWDYAEEVRSRTVTDAAITSGQTALTSSTAAFTSSDAGQTVKVVGAGAAGADLTTTIAAYTNATTVTLAAAAGTTVSAASMSLTASDKTTSGTINPFVGHFAYAPHAIFGRPSGTVKSVGLVGDSITWGQGGAPYSYGSWAVQALNPAGVTAGLATAVAVSIPYVNESMPGETVCNLAAPTTHAFRLAQLAKVKYVLGMLGTNDIAVPSPATTIEGCLITLANAERRRGSSPYYTTVVPRTSSTDGWMTPGGQTVTANESIRVAYNTWLRDGAPISSTTGLPVAVGSSSTTTNRAAYINPDGTVATAASGPGNHPLAGVYEMADVVETARNSGIWKADGVAQANCSITTGTAILTCTGASFDATYVNRYVSVPGAGTAGAALIAFVASQQSATQVTLALNAAATVSNVTAYIAQGVYNDNVGLDIYTHDGTHPSMRGHRVMGQAAANLVNTWVW